MSTLDSKFTEMKYTHFSSGQALKGWMVISRLQGLMLYIKLGWELLTTFVIYSPGITDFMRDMICSTRRHWNDLSEDDQTNVIAFLSHLNKHGKVDKALIKYQ